MYTSCRLGVTPRRIAFMALYRARKTRCSGWGACAPSNEGATQEARMSLTLRDGMGEWRGAQQQRGIAATTAQCYRACPAMIVSPRFIQPPPPTRALP